MKPGPRPKPSTLKALAGNPGKRPLKDTKAADPCDLKAPDWLDELARAKWEEVAPGLIKSGTLSRGDKAILEGYCKAYSRWRQAEAIIDSTPRMEFRIGNKKYAQQIPQVAIAQKYLGIMRQYAVELGLTPSARETVDGNLEDEDEAYFSGKDKGK